MFTVEYLARRARLGRCAQPVQVEVTLASGLAVFYTVSPPAAAVKESGDRVRAALLSCGFESPAGRIIVNLAPAKVAKEAGRFQRPMALGILMASGQLTPWLPDPPCEPYVS